MGFRQNGSEVEKRVGCFKVPLDYLGLRVADFQLKRAQI